MMNMIYKASIAGQQHSVLGAGLCTLSAQNSLTSKTSTITNY